MQKEPLFHELDLSGIRGACVILDCDGTLAPHHTGAFGSEVLAQVAHLAENNEVHFCSNRRDQERNRALARELGILYLETKLRKPNRSVATHLAHKKILVIGDKWLTDGLFARNIGGRFIKVRSMTASSDPYSARMQYAIDRLLSPIMKRVVPCVRS